MVFTLFCCRYSLVCVCVWACVREREGGCACWCPSVMDNEYVCVNLILHCGEREKERRVSVWDSLKMSWYLTSLLCPNMHTHTLSFGLPLTQAITLAHTLSYTNALTNKCPLTLSSTPPLSLCGSLSFSLSLFVQTCTHTHSHTHTRTPARTRTRSDRRRHQHPQKSTLQLRPNEPPKKRNLRNKKNRNERKSFFSTTLDSFSVFRSEREKPDPAANAATPPGRGISPSSRRKSGLFFLQLWEEQPR